MMKKILAIGSHPDDIELGCSGTLLRHKENGDEVSLLVLTGGEASGDPDVREIECRESAKALDADNLIFGKLPDTKISDGFETISLIENVLDQLNPDIVYTQCYKDTHQDHRNAGYATLSAARRVDKILMYESPTTFKEFNPQMFIDIQQQFERKKEIIRIFKSQSNKKWWSIGSRSAIALEGLAYYRGFQSGLYVAEAFEIFRYVYHKDEKVSF